jgi:hypothetical protein
VGGGGFQAKNHVKRQLSGQKLLAGGDAGGMGAGGVVVPSSAGRVVKGELKADYLKGEANQTPLRQVCVCVFVGVCGSCLVCWCFVSGVLSTCHELALQEVHAEGERTHHTHTHTHNTGPARVVPGNMRGLV